MRKFIWNFHRISGIGLIILISLKILTGFSMIGKITIMDSSLSHSIHVNPWLDIPILFLFIFHALYGLFKIFSRIMERDKHKMLFFILNLLGIIILASSLVLIYFI